MPKAKPKCYEDFMGEVEEKSVEEVCHKLLDDIEGVLGIAVRAPDDLKIERVSSRKSPRGYYDRSTRVLKLNDAEGWCRSTLIHELLEAASFFNCNLRFKVKGKVYNIASHMSSQTRCWMIAELWCSLLQGLVLFHKYPNCYESWVERKYPYCSLAYNGVSMKIFACMALITGGLRELVELYLYPCTEDWLSKYQGFLRKHGLDDFIFIKIKGVNLNFRSLEYINVIKRSLERNFKPKYKECFHKKPLSEILNEIYSSYHP